MITPQGVCFWLTIDLPGFRGGALRAAALLAALDDPVAGFPAGRDVPFFAAGLPPEGGLRWAMGLPSADR
jgi:hypothetical protein